ncbi:hypothetical protein [Bacillus sp. EB600]|uniref:hypothetical protein n=1 Tax=Bacillus sp. EB600 TaxID=2806345 RepID=UPI00210F09EB|nr:hypothetical protein [Bacillus sp. EB600]MCQ6282696.1 hypothetical protein [Bacillus sp. EB600]
MGHNRSVEEVVNAAIQEDVQGIAMSSYQGGHVEYLNRSADITSSRRDVQPICPVEDAKKAAQTGVDGLILVCAGAGGATPSSYS